MSGGRRAAAVEERQRSCPDQEGQKSIIWDHEQYVEKNI
jgi:hypothetical protein